MREISVPPNYVAGPCENLTDDVFDHAEHWPDHIGFSRREDDRWVPVTYREFAEQVVLLAAGLMASGLQSGDRVALFSRTRFEWMLCDFAIWTAGGVTVPVYETSSAEQVEWMLSDPGAVAAIVETEDHAKTVAQVQIGLPGTGRTASTSARVKPGRRGKLASPGCENPVLHRPACRVRIGGPAPGVGCDQSGIHEHLMHVEVLAAATCCRFEQRRREQPGFRMQLQNRR